MPRTSEIPGALERCEFDVYYQPQVCMADRRPVGCEALVRWRHPRLGLLAADRFIPIAEDDGQVRGVDAWVRGQALIDRAAGRLCGTEVAVNLSPNSLRPDLADVLVAELAEHGVGPRELVVEVTERVRVRSLNGAVDALAEVARVDVRLALDDFGAGATSITDLSHLPVHRIKLDRSLVSDLTGPAAPRGRLVVRAIRDLAEHLGMEVLAEGIETAEQESILLDEGITLGQGFLYGRPEPLAPAA